MTETTTALPEANLVTRSMEERRTARRERWRLLRKRPGFIIGLSIVVVWLLAAIFGRHITPFDPFTDLSGPQQSPNGTHWFGTDKIGRDIFSRVVVGARDVLLVAPPAAIISVVLGTILGIVMGYYRGWVDNVASRFVEAFLALPVVMVGLLVLTLTDSSPTLKTITFDSRKLLVIYVVSLLFTPIVARTVRSAVLGERDLDYVVSAKLRGESNFFIMTREILPNITGPIIVELTVRIGYAIFTVATLSFLGAGPQRPSPDWGLAISEGRDLLPADIWWPVLFPSLAIVSLVVATNLIADSIQAVYER